jgi:hypothetical protein
MPHNELTPLKVWQDVPLPPMSPDPFHRLDRIVICRCSQIQAGVVNEIPERKQGQKNKANTE